MEKYLAGEELSVEEIKGAIRKPSQLWELYPVLCGSAFKNRGVQPMLDAVIDYLPTRWTSARCTATVGDEDEGN